MTNATDSRRISGLDGLRGYAALAVLFFHSILLFVGFRPPDHGVNAMMASSIWSTPSEDCLGRLVIALLDGQTAVLIFFVISGMVLTRSLCSHDGENRRMLVLAFIVRRILRIYPALIVCLVAFFIVEKILNYLNPQAFPYFTAMDFLRNASLLSITMHGASWTLQAEIIAMPLILIAYFAFKKFGWVALLCMSCYAIFVREYTVLGFGSVSAYVWMPGFLAGVVAARVPKGYILDVGWFVPLALLFLTPVFTNPASVTASIIQIISAFFLISHVLKAERSYLNMTLSAPASLYLGKISYSLYLWNVPLMFFVKHSLKGHASGDHYLANGISLGIVLTVLTVPIAHVSEKYLEHASRLMSSRRRMAVD